MGLPNDPDKTYYLVVFVTTDCPSCKYYLRHSAKMAEELTELLEPEFEAKGFIADDEDDAKVVYRVINDVGLWQVKPTKYRKTGEVEKLISFPQIYLADLEFSKHGKWEFIVPPGIGEEDLDEVIESAAKDIIAYNKDGEEKVKEALQAMKFRGWDEFDTAWELRQEVA